MNEPPDLLLRMSASLPLLPSFSLQNISNNDTFKEKRSTSYDQVTKSNQTTTSLDPHYKEKRSWSYDRCVPFRTNSQDPPSARSKGRSTSPRKRGELKNKNYEKKDRSKVEQWSLEPPKQIQTYHAQDWKPRETLKYNHLVNPSHIPGYFGHIPGKISETCYGTCFPTTNENAQKLRQDNPYNSTANFCRDDSKYKTILGSRLLSAGFGVRADNMNYLTTPEKEELKQFCFENSIRTNLVEAVERKKPKEDRYGHLLYPPMSVQQKMGLSPGTKAFSGSTEQLRWVDHNAQLRDGALVARMRCPY